MNVSRRNFLAGLGAAVLGLATAGTAEARANYYTWVKWRRNSRWTIYGPYNNYDAHSKKKDCLKAGAWDAYVSTRH